jgi:hypothetical protein
MASEPWSTRAATTIAGGAKAGVRHLEGRVSCDLADKADRCGRNRTMFKPMRSMASDPEGKVLLTSAFLLLAVGTIVYTVLEGRSPLDSLYFCVVTLATVGFGDYTPTTDLARLFTIGDIITGIGILTTFVSELTRHRGEAAALRLKRTSSVGATVTREAEGLEERVEPDLER